MKYRVRIAENPPMVRWTNLTHLLPKPWKMTRRCFRFPPPDPLTSAMLAETSNLGRRMAGSTQRVAEFVLGKWRLGSVLLKICEQNTQTCYIHVHRVYGLVPVCNMSCGTRIAHAWTFVTEPRIKQTNTSWIRTYFITNYTTKLQPKEVSKWMHHLHLQNHCHHHHLNIS